MSFPSTATFTDHIRVDRLSHSYGDRVVLDGIDLVVDRSERLGLIGENGAGKSTLLRLIAGVESPERGTIARPAHTGFLWQEVQARAGASVGDLIEASLRQVRAVERELEDAAAAVATDPDRYSRALEAAERADVWSLDARRDEVLQGLSIADIPLDRPLVGVSGGQRSRFALAALLLARPEALLLDEPTNHLDDSAIEFLRGQLLGWRGAVLFASHDRAFLDEVATSLVDIDRSRDGLTRFGRGPAGGPYTEYLVQKKADRERWEARFATEQDELNRLRFAVNVTTRTIAPGRGPRDNDKFAYGFKAGTHQVAVARRVRNAEVRLATLERDQVRKPPAPLTFTGIPHGSNPLETGTLVQLTDARVDGRLHLDRLAIEPNTRLLVTGRNGAGKSTLLAALSGSLELDGGRIDRRRGLRIGLLEQDIRWVDPDSSPRAIYENVLGQRAEQVPLQSLGLVAPRDLDRPVGALSIGQQRRLALALIIAKPPHLFLLDEPTNHLSLALATDLEDALGGYPGAVVVASHDRWLRSRWSGRTLDLG